MTTFPVSFNVRAAASRGLRVTTLTILGSSLALLWTALNLRANSNWIFSAVFMATGVFLLRPAIGQRGADLFSPACLFPAAYCFWFGLGSLDILPPQLQFSLFEPIPLRMWGYYSVGLAGYFLAVGYKRNEMLPRAQTGLSSTWDGCRFAPALAALTLIGTATYIYLVHKGGIPILSGEWAESRVEIGRQNGLAFTVFLCSFWTVIPMLFVCLWTNPRQKALSIFTYSVSAVLAFMLLSMGSRAFLFVPALIVVIIRHHLLRRWRIAQLVPIGILAFALIGVAGYMRDFSRASALSEMGFPDWIQPFAPAYLYLRGPVATFRDTSALISAQDNFQHGALFLSPFAVLTPGHHLSSDLFFRAILRDNFVGFGEPATLLGVFYADFGVAGIFVGMFATGLLARWLYRNATDQGSPLSVLLFSYYSYVLLFGLFGTLFPYLATLWIPLMFIAIDKFAHKPLCPAV